MSASTVESAASRAICRVTEQSATINTSQSAVTHLMSDTEGAEIRNYKEDRESTSIPTRWIKVGVAMYLQSTFMNLTLYKFKLHKP